MHNFRVRCCCRSEFVWAGSFNDSGPQACPLCGSLDAVSTRCGPDAEMFELVRGVFGPEVQEIRQPWEVPGLSGPYPTGLAPDGLVYGDSWERAGEELWVSW